MSGLVLSRYALVKLLARGGMGSIYLARTEGAAGFKKPVVVKLIHPHLMHDPKAVNSFVREAKLAARLVHPNIVQVVDFGDHAGQYLAVLEYVHGYDLGVLAKYLSETDRPLSMAHAAYVMHEVLRGLEFAHELRDESGEHLGLVHRDISPHNVMFNVDGQVKLTDFGIARISTEVTVDDDGALKGKLAYLAPEQVSGGQTDHRSDLFAVGIVLHEILSGERLFYSDSEALTIMRVNEAQITDVRVARPELPALITDILNKALARDPDARYQSADDFAADLRKLPGAASPDDIAPSFRAMVTTVIEEPGFTSTAGHLTELATALKADALDVGPATPEQAPAPSAQPEEPPPPPSMLRLLALGLGVALLAGMGAAAFLFTRSPRPPGPGRPVAVIIDRSTDAGTKADGRLALLRSDGGAPDGSASAHNADADSATEVTPDGGHAPRRLAKLTGRAVTRRLMRRRSALRSCFQRHRNEDIQVSTVTVRMEITRDGTVRAASVEPAVGGLGSCLASVARSTRFPRHPDEAVAFRVPIRVQR